MYSGSRDCHVPFVESGVVLTSILFVLTLVVNKTKSIQKRLSCKQRVEPTDELNMMPIHPKRESQVDNSPQDDISRSSVNIEEVRDDQEASNHQLGSCAGSISNKSLHRLQVITVREKSRDNERKESNKEEVLVSTTVLKEVAVNNQTVDISDTYIKEGSSSKNNYIRSFNSVAPEIRNDEKTIENLKKADQFNREDIENDNEEIELENEIVINNTLVEETVENSNNDKDMENVNEDRLPKAKEDKKFNVDFFILTACVVVIVILGGISILDLEYGSTLRRILLGIPYRMACIMPWIIIFKNKEIESKFKRRIDQLKSFIL